MEVFSTLESGNKMVTLTSDTLFDLLVLMLTNVYKKKKQKTESREPISVTSSSSTVV